MRHQQITFVNFLRIILRRRYTLLCLQISLQNIEEYLVTGPIHIIQCQVYCSSRSMFFVLFLEICNNQTQLTLMSCVNIWYRLQIAAWACNIFSQLVSIFHKFFQAFSTSELFTSCLNLIQLFNNFWFFLKSSKLFIQVSIFSTSRHDADAPILLFSLVHPLFHVLVNCWKK